MLSFFEPGELVQEKIGPLLHDRIQELIPFIFINSSDQSHVWQKEPFESLEELRFGFHGTTCVAPEKARKEDPLRVGPPLEVEGSAGAQPEHRFPGHPHELEIGVGLLFLVRLLLGF